MKKEQIQGYIDQVRGGNVNAMQKIREEIKEIKDPEERKNAIETLVSLIRNNNSGEEKETRNKDAIMYENRTKEIKQQREIKLKKLFSDGMKLWSSNNPEEREKWEKINSIIKALRNEKVLPYYQLISPADENQIEKKPHAKYEVLGRAKKEDGDLIGAGDLFSIAEEYGLSEYINQIIYTKAIKEIHKDNDLTDISVNLEQTELTNVYYYIYIAKLAKSENINPDRITIEITENVNRIQPSILDRFRKDGFKIALDDAPVWANTPSRINEIKPDIVKVDFKYTQAFFKGDKKAINDVKEVLKASEKAGAQVVFEWIENKKMHDMVMDISKNYKIPFFVQGFAIDKPSENRISIAEWFKNLKKCA